MGGWSSKQSPEERAMTKRKAQDVVDRNPLVVFSKTYCPYCTKAKKLLASVGARPKVIELDIEGDGSELQADLAEWTGQRTVPNIFIGGKHIGGCDDTVATHNAGKLIPLLKDAGALE